LSDEPLAPRFAGNPDRLDREGLLALVRDLQRTVVLQQQTIERHRASASNAAVRSPGLDIAEDPSSLDKTIRSNRVQQPRAPIQRAAMPPVPGADYSLVFDGGSLGNPGRGYGSYQIVDAGGAVVAQERLEFGDRITNNGAEFRTLIAALEHLLRLGDDDARRGTLAVRGDSQLVIHGITGQWKIKHADLKPLRDRAVALLSEFGARDIAWHGRDESVRALGH